MIRSDDNREKEKEMKQGSSNKERDPLLCKLGIRMLTITRGRGSTNEPPSVTKAFNPIAVMTNKSRGIRMPTITRGRGTTPSVEEDETSCSVAKTSDQSDSRKRLSNSREAL